MEYGLMHKDDRVAILDFDTQLGSLNKIKIFEKDIEAFIDD